MKGDRELCTAAVAKNETALQWASEEMKGDREVCKAAVAQDAYALDYMSDEMKRNSEVVVAAVLQRQRNGINVHDDSWQKDFCRYRKVSEQILKMAVASLKT